MFEWELLGPSSIKGVISLFSLSSCCVSCLSSLPRWMRDPEYLEKEIDLSGGYRDSSKRLVEGAEGVEVEKRVFRLNRKVAKLYNSTIQKGRNLILDLHPTRHLSYHSLMTLFFLIRLLSVFTSFYWPSLLLPTLLSTLLQFVIMPYSFYVSFTQFFALAPSLFYHYILLYPSLYFLFPFFTQNWETYVITPLQDLPLLSSLFPFLSSISSLTITPTFIALFLLVDQLLCVLCTFYVPGEGKTEPQTPKRLLSSFIYGFLNCKTYHCVLLLHCLSVNTNKSEDNHLQIPVFLWVVDAWLGISDRLARLIGSFCLHWQVLFYHQHRSGHLPLVYEQAHKFHHYLHDSNAFDAHIYGSGAPEEFFLLWFEILVAKWFGMVPPSLTYRLLHLSWTNKQGHTRKVDGTGGVNNHANHHTYHRKNFGIYGMFMDMYFGTCVDNERNEYGEWKILHQIDGEESVFEFSRLVEKEEKKKSG